MSKDKTELTAPHFRARVNTYATQILREWVGDAKAGEAIGRVSNALAAAAASARNPQDFYECTPQSIAKVVATAALTGIMPSTGGAALAYAIPRRPRKGEPPQLQYQLSHRGIAALARRAGLAMVAYPIGMRDEIESTEDGDCRVVSIDRDDPPTTEAELRGVVVIVRDVQSGQVVARGYVAKKLINARRDTSDSYQFAEKPGNDWAKDSDPWHKWYVEMAIKTAMHYAVNRGWCVIDDTSAVRALQVDADVTFPTNIDVQTGNAKLTELLTEVDVVAAAGEVT